MNSKIKVLRRISFGFRDERLFELILFVLNDFPITRNVR
ncbi:transposase [Bacteroides pyogenes]|nr:transposase [Bacteroides pyogenes]